MSEENNKPRVIPAAWEHGDKTQEGKWLNHKGRFVPEKNVAEYDRKKENLVIPLIRTATELSGLLEEFKRRAFQAWREFDVEAMEEYGVEINTDKGNGTLYSFDQRYKIQMCSSAVLEFDTRLKAASELISECLADWGQNADPNLMAVVSEAFEKDAKGMINVRKVLGLRRLQINDERWQVAMQAISDATMEVGRAAYLNFYERVEMAPGRSEWRLIPLSLARA